MFTGEHERIRTGDQRVAVSVAHPAGAYHPIAEIATVNGSADISLGGALTTAQHEDHIVIELRQSRQQQQMAFMRVGDGRVHDHWPGLRADTRADLIDLCGVNSGRIGLISLLVLP